MAVSYEIVMRGRAGREHALPYTSEDRLTPGSIVLLRDRYWLVDRVEERRVYARPARYRLTLRHASAPEEAGSFRRFRDDAPRLGHQLTTLERGVPVSWEVVDEQLAHDEEGEPFLELIAQRDYAEADSLPDHQLEDALEEDDTAAAALARAEEAGLAIELVALEAGQAPDWEETERFLHALVLDGIGDDLLQLCGVDPRNDPRGTWLDAVKERLRDDLESFRADLEGDQDAIEEWDFRGGRIFAAIGRIDDESNPLSGYGWLCRLVDSGALGVAGFQRVRKAVLQP